MERISLPRSLYSLLPSDGPCSERTLPAGWQCTEKAPGANELTCLHAP